jgi:hypothetical protein
MPYNRSAFTRPVRITEGIQYVSNADGAVATLIDTTGVLGSAAFDVVAASLAAGGAIGANTTVQSSVTVSCNATDILLAVVPPSTGITSGDGPDVTSLGVAYAFVSAANTVAIGWVSQDPITRAAGTYNFVFIRN